MKLEVGKDGVYKGRLLQSQDPLTGKREIIDFTGREASVNIPTIGNSGPGQTWTTLSGIGSGGITTMGSFTKILGNNINNGMPNTLLGRPVVWTNNLIPKSESSSFHKYDRESFEKDFPNEEACYKWLVETNYPDGIKCEKCGRVTNHTYYKQYKSYQCAECGTHMHATKGTVYHKGGISLLKWFNVVYIIRRDRDVDYKDIAEEVQLEPDIVKDMIDRLKSQPGW